MFQAARGMAAASLPVQPQGPAALLAQAGGHSSKLAATKLLPHKAGSGAHSPGPIINHFIPSRDRGPAPVTLPKGAKEVKVLLNTAAGVSSLGILSHGCFSFRDVSRLRLDPQRRRGSQVILLEPSGGRRPHGSASASCKTLRVSSPWEQGMPFNLD